MTADTSLTPSRAVALLKHIEKLGHEIALRNEERWQGYLMLGDWIKERMDKCAELAGGTRGPKFSGFLKGKQGLGQFYPRWKKLSDDGVVSSLNNIIANRKVVENWRNRLDEPDRPSSPRRVWDAYQASLRGKDVPVVADEDDEDDEEATPARKNMKRTADDDKRDLQIELAKQIEKVEGQQMTTDPEINAQRIWRAMKDTVGDVPAAISLALATAGKLKAMAERVRDSATEHPPVKRAAAKKRAAATRK